MSEASPYGIVSSTFANREDARRVAGALLAEKLAACVQLMEIESHYAWKGEIRHEPEVMLLAKTREALFSRVIERIKALHPYETPEIVAQNFSAGFQPYLDWIGAETKS
ncbi:MAG TPA: divalent-cation tolerance protein CutA [Rhizomicrobium sp.]|jgi:periplasmic divalent cation tolerance protein|nr:divalent-cation tolerance protein CutA [Rhizomicrobium sp.]